MKHKISIIIPIYNTENYLKRTLESILKQTYTNFEALLIDDGSTDNSAEIAKKYTQIDDRFKYFLKSNGGQSSARNFGLKQASGEYIVFVDSDDWVDNDYLQNFGNEITTSERLIIQDLKIVNDNNKEIKRYSLNYKDELIVLDTMINDLVSNYRFTVGYATNKLFSLGVIRKNNLVLNESVTICEDEIFYFNYIKFIKEIKFIAKDSYNYYQRSDSQTSFLPSFNSELIHLKESIKFLDFISLKTKDINISNRYKKIRINGLFKFIYFTVMLKQFDKKNFKNNLIKLNHFFKENDLHQYLDKKEYSSASKLHLIELYLFKRRYILLLSNLRLILMKLKF